jgi:transcriptional regulator with XRE-family HTH domain
MDEVGSVLAAAREAAGMTQAQVAGARHVSRGAQSQIEMATARPSWDTIDSLARAIDSSVVLRFELANGAVVSGRCAGIHRPTLASNLYADAKEARQGALEAGWKTTGDHEIHRARDGYGAFPTVNRLVSIIEPENWQLQTALTVLMSTAAADGIDGGQGSMFGYELHLITHGPDGKDEEDLPAFDVTKESQIALDALLGATRSACRDVRWYAEFRLWNLETLPVRGLASYLSTGAPGVDEVEALVNRISRSAEWRLAILREAGYLYGEPADYDLLPQIFIEEV